MVTRKDIAERLNVSVSVVSRALNNSGYVEETKRRKILKAAEEMGYHPNPVAMSLQQRRTKQILYYSKDLDNFHNIELYEGMLDEAEKSGYLVLLNGRFDFEAIPSLMIDGVILPNIQISELYLREIGKKYHLPVVTAGYGEPINLIKSIPRIESDLYEGTQDALAYLYKKGHRKIAHLTPYALDNIQSRTTAWFDYMRCELDDTILDYYFGINKMDLKEDDRIYRFQEERSSNTTNVWEDYFGKGIFAAELFAERNTDATAVMAFNDEMALGFCQKIQSLGYRIPEDLSIIGVDGIPEGQHHLPRLTTLGIQARKMGARCFKELMAVINGDSVRYMTHIPTKIIEGETVKQL